MEKEIYRNTFALKLKPNSRYSYGQLLSKNWDRLTERLDFLKVNNFSIWNVDNIVFGYCETNESPDNWSIEEKEFFNQLAAEFEGCLEWISKPWTPMRLMYSDYGIIRQCKELIRHRVFVTKLYPEMEEEYKARHDNLSESMSGINYGPNSNFTIWTAGGYIFGYDEIDTTMEQEKTELDIQNEIEWETRMLEIMTWITDDVDWLTKDHHSHIKRICYH